METGYCAFSRTTFGRAMRTQWCLREGGGDVMRSENQGDEKGTVKKTSRV